MLLSENDTFLITFHKFSSHMAMPKLKGKGKQNPHMDLKGKWEVLVSGLRGDHSDLTIN